MHRGQKGSPFHVAFLSSNDDWGGSEELWSRTALRLARAGTGVSAYKRHIHRAEAVTTALKAAGCHVVDLHGMDGLPRKLRSLISSIWPIYRILQEIRFRWEFRLRPPSLAVISQGLNYDGWHLAATCRRLGLPYILISQKASDLYWPPDGLRDGFQAAYRNAAASLFVSRHNEVLTEEQLGFRLANSHVVRNPFNADWTQTTPWPDDEGTLRLACLARFDAREKGQDLIFRVLAMPKWRKRNLTVRMHGAGQNLRALSEMAALLGLTNVEFAGFTSSPETIWRDAHGLILPSRCEGLPLSLIEAMLHGRMAIVTDVGGNSEAVIDGVTGFVAAAATEGSLDATLEEAWRQRRRWRAMGAAGAEHARTLVEPDPVQTLVELIPRFAARGADAPK